MTSEVVVMNRMGVALAADSAVTIEVGASSKVRDSAVKLFMLSKYRPVGVMVYNDSLLLGVPWETIIKVFRRDVLGRRSFDTLAEFGNELIRFLDGNSALFPETVQAHYFLQVLEVEYRRIGKEVEKELEFRGQFGNTATDVAEDVIAAHLETWQQREDAEYFRNVDAKRVVGRLSGEVHEVANRMSARWGVGAEAARNLYEIAELLVAKDFPPDVSSGLVIAGFGDTEHFPAVLDLQIGGIYDDKLKVRPTSPLVVSDDNPASIMAFAYTDMVEAFLNGISPRVRAQVEDATTYIREMPPMALEAVAGLSPQERARAVKGIREESRDKAAQFAEEVLRNTNDRRQKIARAVGTLTIGELAQVASTLVGLSSFEQQMSLDQQTVGGPVDVAVISKGDGFIWIKRKHYFPRELNEHFIRNYNDVDDRDAPAAGDAADGDEEDVQDGK